MKSHRKLSLKREVLTSLTDADLDAVAGAQPKTLDGCTTTLNTCFSCLTYISCNPAACTFTITVLNC